MLTRPSAFRKADEELHVAQERLALALEVAGLSVWDWDVPSGALTFVPPIYDLFGYPPNDEPQHIQGRNLTHPDDLATFDAAFEAHMRGDTPRLDVEVRMHHANGTWLWIHCRGEIVTRAKDGTPLRLVGTFADVSEKREEAEDRKFLSDLSVLLVETSNPASLVSIAIQRLAEHLGVARVGISQLNDARDTFVTRSVWSHLSLPVAPSNHRTAYTPKMIEDACAGPVCIENVETDPRMGNAETAELYRKMGICAFLNVPMRAEGRNPMFLFAQSAEPRCWKPREVDLLQQVAERLWNSIDRASAEQSRQTSDTLLSMAVQTARLAAFERNLLTGSIRLSEGFFDILGHPEISSGTLVDYMAIIHPDDLEGFAAKIATARAIGQEYELVDSHRIFTASGEIRQIAYKARTYYEPDEDGNNRLVRAAAIIQDVTEQKEQAEQTAAALERIHKLERLTAMGTMASTLAHELNQPLASASNYLNVLRALERNASPSAEINPGEVINLAAKSVEDAGKIIRKIRNFTSGGGLQRRNVSVEDLVRSATDGLKEQFGKQTPALIKDIPEKLTVNVDELQLNQVLANLLRNAAEAMAGQKDACITISASQSGNDVVISVADNGPGIPEDVAAGLFSPFQSTKRDGMGIGLSLCRTMVEAHGGHLTLERHDSTGCTFVVHLPKAGRNDDPAARRAAPA